MRAVPIAKRGMKTTQFAYQHKWHVLCGGVLHRKREGTLHTGRSMRKPLQITFQDLPVDARAWALIEEKVAKLEMISPDLQGVRVVVNAPHQRHRARNQYSVRVEMTVPGRELIRSRVHGDHPATQNLFVAIREAFRAAERQLVSFRRNRVESLRGPQARRPTGKVIRLFPYEGFGFLLSDDGREVYFEQGAVAKNQFPLLQVGQTVHFAEAEGLAGPRASRVEAQ